jgi:DNA modification methylase
MSTNNKLFWHTEKRKIKDLIPFDKNPRILSEFQEEKLKDSLKKFGLVEIPVIDVDNKLIAGHQRIKILILLGRGSEEIDVRVPNRKLSQQEFEEYNLRSNVSNGEWDLDLLKNIDTDILLDIGMDENVLSNMWNETLSVEDDEFDVDKTISEIKVPKTKLGDLIILGNHRLHCADNQNPESVKKLVGDNKINMLNFDPIYNIGLDYNNGISTKGKYGGTVKDKKSDIEYRNFLRTALQNGLNYCFPDVHCMCWCDEKFIGMLQSIYSELGIDNKRVCIWVKNNCSPTPQVAFSKVFESCVYGTRGSPYLSPTVHNLSEIMNKEIGTGNRLCDDIFDIFNLWLVNRVNAQEYCHPTQKPASLYEKSLRRCTKPGDIVLDLFGGSGSQMVACEQLKRKAFLCEIDPVFCDVIVKRFKDLTGQEAIYEN